MSATVSMRDALYEAPGPRTRKRVAVGTAISLVALAGLIAFVIRQFYINDQLIHCNIFHMLHIDSGHDPVVIQVIFQAERIQRGFQCCHFSS